MVVQAVLLFGAETRVLTETMIQRLEGGDVSFLWQVPRIHEERSMDGSWRLVTAKAFLQGAETHTLMKYVERQQATGNSGGVGGHPAYF